MKKLIFLVISSVMLFANNLEPLYRTTNYLQNKGIDVDRYNKIIERCYYEHKEEIDYFLPQMLIELANGNIDFSAMVGFAGIQFRCLKSEKNKHFMDSISRKLRSDYDLKILLKHYNFYITYIVTQSY